MTGATAPLTLLYIFGPPGSGKSLLLKFLLRDFPPRLRFTQPFAMTLRARAGDLPPYRDGILELGASRPGPFSGTDALGQSVIGPASAWIAHHPWPRLIAEGDRLAVASFWRVAAYSGYSVVPVLLDAPDDVLAARRAHRASITSTHAQDAAWALSRATKARNLAAAWQAQTIVLDASLTPPALAAALHAAPALAPLWHPSPQPVYG